MPNQNQNNTIDILIDPNHSNELREIKNRNNKDIFDDSVYYQVFLCSINFDYFLNKVCDFTKNLNNILLAVIILAFYIIWWAIKVPLLIILSKKYLKTLLIKIYQKCYLKIMNQITILLIIIMVFLINKL